MLNIAGISTSSAAPASTPEELIESSKDILRAKFGADLRAKLKSEEGDKSIHSVLCLIQKLTPNYQIRPSSLPTTKQLIEWGSLEIYEKARLFPTDVESVLDAILAQYLKSKPPVALVSYPLLHSVSANSLDLSCRTNPEHNDSRPVPR